MSNYSIQHEYYWAIVRINLTYTTLVLASGIVNHYKYIPELSIGHYIVLSEFHNKVLMHIFFI